MALTADREIVRERFIKDISDFFILNIFISITNANVYDEAWKT